MKELDKGLRQIMEENNIKHHRMSVELITPRRKATPFLKLTFLTQNDRRDATKKLNAVKTSTGFTISPIEPREVQSWLPHYKKTARANILSCLQEKGYNVADSDISIVCKWRYNPFHFVWNIRCDVYGLNINISDELAFTDMISDAQLQRRVEPVENLATVPAADQALQTEAQEAISSSVKDIIDTQTHPGSSPKTKAKIKEQEQKLFIIATAVVKSITNFPAAYKHDERAIKRIQAYTSKSKSLPEMKKSYTDFKIAFNNPTLLEAYFAGDKKDTHRTVARLLKEGFFNK